MKIVSTEPFDRFLTSEMYDGGNGKIWQICPNGLIHLGKTDALRRDMEFINPRTSGLQITADPRDTSGK